MTSSKVRSIAALGAILALLLVGCNTTYEMAVDAISNPSITDTESYIIIHEILRPIPTIYGIRRR